jgi:hypothetical protein
MNKPSKQEELPKAQAKIPEGWVEIINGNSEPGDKTWNPDKQEFQTIGEVEVDEWVGYFYCLIRERRDRCIDWDEDDFEMDSEWFIDGLEDAVCTELFSCFNPITHVRIGNRAWKIVRPDIEEDPESQWVQLVEIDPKTIEHLP